MGGILDELNTFATPENGENVGDLEPPMDTLELLLNSDLIRDDVRSVLDLGPLQELLEFKLETLKPLPPPPPRAPTPPPQPIASTSKLVLSLGKSKKANAKLSTKPISKSLEPPPPQSFKITVPRPTRRSLAAAAAFEAEAEQQPVPHVPAPIPVRSHKKKPTSLAAAPVRSHKRKSSLPPVEPPRTEDNADPDANLTARKTFEYFETGWILPQGQKRGGRRAPEPALADKPPPRKRVRTAEPSTSSIDYFLFSSSNSKGLGNQRSSVLASSSTGEAENQTLAKTESEVPETYLPDETAMEVDDYSPAKLNDHHPEGSSGLARTEDMAPEDNNTGEDTIMVVDELAAEEALSAHNTILDSRYPGSPPAEPDIVMADQHTLPPQESDIIEQLAHHHISPTGEEVVGEQLEPISQKSFTSAPPLSQSPSPVPEQSIPPHSQENTTFPSASRPTSKKPSSSLSQASPVASTSKPPSFSEMQFPTLSPPPVSSRTRRTSTRHEDKLATSELPLQRIITDEDGNVIVEHLDTPATRRKPKNRRQPVAGPSTEQAPSDPTVHIPKEEANEGDVLSSGKADSAKSKPGVPLNEAGVIDGGTLGKLYATLDSVARC